MKILPPEKALTRRRILRTNILLGLTAFIFAFYMLATSDFSSYSQLRASEALYNRVALGGLIYAALSWIFCTMSKPFWFPTNKNH